uniref:ribonuclease P n=1 Tax=Anthurium amnicola TaxID=1678845 RepID=A0A1D1ZH13_9ARAE
MAGQPSLPAAPAASVAGRKRKKNPTPEWEFQQGLAACSRGSDLAGALALYRAAAEKGLHLTAYHFNTLLHICSNALGSPGGGEGGAAGRASSSVATAVGEAFRIFDHMVASGIHPSESTITSMARIAAADEVEGRNGAFELVRDMGTRHGLTPRLRTYGPALFAFCRRAEDAEKAFAVEQHMASTGISPEEPELAALLKVSSEARREGKVYEYLHKLRGSVGRVSPSTADTVERWFESDCAADAGREPWDVGLVKNAVLLNGGGWHGKGWLGKGKWRVQRSNVGPDGCCSCCGERLACVDIDRTETEKFAEAVASLAMAREGKSNFRNFQEWLNNHADYEVVVDGANVGYYHQNFADGGFCLSQVGVVVKELLESGLGKRPLVILHNKRVLALMKNDFNRHLLEDWKAQGALYATPNGSNDDWYWLYASVKLKCLLVTNDEMRDHIFELLGRNFFPRWKERHQVRYTYVKGNLRLERPPPYTLVIQESEMGSWHLPVDDNGEDEKLHAWLCITRGATPK